jgi:hypothetical protein
LDGVADGADSNSDEGLGTKLRVSAPSAPVGILVAVGVETPLLPTPVGYAGISRPGHVLEFQNLYKNITETTAATAVNLRRRGAIFCKSRIIDIVKSRG